MSSKANERQVGGDHYKTGNEIQHWDFVAANDMDYFQGQITKYVTRWKKKNGIADLEKAQHFLEKYIELEKEKRESLTGKEKTFTYRSAIFVPADCALVKGSVSKQVVETGQKYPFGYNDEEERDGSGK